MPYRDKLYSAYREDPIGTLLWAFCIYIIIAIGLYMLAPELEQYLAHIRSDLSELVGRILAGLVGLFSLLAAPLIVVKS